jgi:hypothetical protein
MSDRVLVIDENLNPRLANQLRNRGRRAVAVEDLRLKSALDPELIEKVFQLYKDPVLVTADDGMPAEHGALLAKVHATVAVVKPWDRDEADIGRWEGQDHRSEEEWSHEILHRWAHTMQTQQTGTNRRYSINAHAAWRPPRRTTRRRT